MKGGAEMNNNAFSTETSPQYVRLQSYKSLLIVFLVFSLAACLGFLVAWQTFMFFELIVIISCVVSLFQNNKKGHHWKLEFENDVLTITNLKTNESFWVSDIPASDFVITQSKAETSLDYCSLMIKNTVFAFGGVKNCQQLKTYIRENYKETA